MLQPHILAKGTLGFWCFQAVSGFRGCVKKGETQQREQGQPEGPLVCRDKGIKRLKP